jgi:hypothetical protein
MGGVSKWEEVDDFADGGMVENVSEAKRKLENMGIEVEKSKSEGFSWFIPDVEYYDDYNQDFYQEHGVHMSDSDLIDFANEFSNGGMMARGGRSLMSMANLVVKDDLKKTKLKNWYTKNYPTDDLGEEINPNVSFKDLWDCLHNNQDVYKLIGVGDSVIRERLFDQLSEMTGHSDDNYVTNLYYNYQNLPESEWSEYPKETMAVAEEYVNPKYISHYKIKNTNEIFVSYDDAMNYCDKNNLPYSAIIKTKKYADGGMMAKGGKFLESQYSKFPNSRINFDKTYYVLINEKSGYVPLKSHNKDFVLEKYKEFKKSYSKKDNTYNVYEVNDDLFTLIGGDDFANGIMARGGKTKGRYNEGLSWHQDHARFNKSQNYERPLKRRRKY